MSFVMSFIHRPGSAKSLAFSFWLLFCLNIGSPPLAAREKRPPNIIYMMADDLGYGDLSCYGQRRFQTPNIDRLASSGMTFTQHYAGSTVCAPSRCSLMTGLHTGHCYVRGNKEHQPVGQEPLPSDTMTVAKLLRESGYATGIFGKWGLGFPGSTGDPLEQGFQEFFGYNCQRNAHTYYPKFLYQNRQRVTLDGETYAHDLIMKRALDFIRANREGPFFCYLPVTIPHAALQVPSAYSSRFREEFKQFNARQGRYAGTTINNPAAAFAGMMTKLDEDLGRVIQLLGELQIERNTLLIFTSVLGIL